MEVMTRNEKAAMFQRSCKFWAILDAKTRDDIIDGKCVYSEYDGVPIIDYTRKRPNYRFWDNEQNCVIG